MRNLLDVPEKLNEGASQRASTHLTSRITHRNIKISLDESLLKIFNWWWPDVERTGRSDDLQPRLARTVSDDKLVPPEYSMSLLTSIMSCFQKPIQKYIKTEGRVTTKTRRTDEPQLMSTDRWGGLFRWGTCASPWSAWDSAPRNGHGPGGEEWQCIKNHLHKKFKPPVGGPPYQSCSFL